MSDAAFANAGKKPGLEVWRIEKLVPTPVNPKYIGQFYDGDAYIVCKTVQKPSSSSFDIDIFFWLGDESSQDEQGVAAYKAVELDESLGGGPTQHREVQGYESDQFMQCFKKVEYLKGGVASGFKHVERDVYEPRLLHLKGARAVRVKTVPLAASSLNSGDVFILDLGKSLIQWNGSECNKKEKAKALDVCLGIKDDERGGKASIDVVEQGKESEAFWAGIGGKGPIAPATDDAAAAAEKGTVKLFRVSDKTGSLVVDEVASGTLKKEMLDTTDVFILDNEGEIFVWIGKGATADERKAGMKVGTDYCAQGNRPKGTKVSKVMESTEPTTFKSNFTTWAAAIMPTDVMTPRGGNVAQVGAQMSSEDLIAAATRQRRETEAAIDDANGKVEVFRIEDFEPVPLQEDLSGTFYAGDSYIVKYTFEKNGKECYILYYWLGSKSTTDEKGAAALHTTKMDDALGGAATQVRVVQGKAPGHFVRIFKGKMVIHSGGKGSGFRNRAQSDAYDKDGVSLFHIRGTGDNDTRAVQVEEKAAFLNSGDCFVLQTIPVVYVWKGSGANDAEQLTARTVAETMQVGRELKEIVEGEEPDEFWEALGGKGEYPQAKATDEGSRDPMLFVCSNSTGTLKMEPVFDYSQADLDEEDVFLLDTFTTIFVWVGSEANATEKKGAQEAAAFYVKSKGYDDDTPVISVKSGSEPAIFTCNFLGWDASAKAKFVDPYEAKLAAARANNPDISDAEAPAPPKRLSVGAAEILGKKFEEPGGAYMYNYEELKKNPAELPAGVDPTKREKYLKDEDFEKVLGSPRGEFEKLKPWKQQQLKKASGLF